MTPAFRYTLLWLAGSMIAVFAALTMLSGGYSNGEFLPSNADAFYHARRILDSVFSGSPVIQFDDRIHAPEGSWLTWPWGFDTILTSITRLFGPYTSEAQANRVLMNIPPVAASIAVGLVVIIARQMALPFFLTVLFVVSFSALPLVFMLFAVGNVDHHFAELLWALGTLSAGTWFFRANRLSYGAGITLGVVLGSALAIHNSLFILQIPIAVALGLFWLRGIPLPHRFQVIAFGAALLTTTLLVCLPSEPWQRGFFEFYTLSWFHFYICACVAAFSILLVMIGRSTRNLVIVLLGATAAMLPIVGSLSLAGEFVSGQLDSIRDIVEASSPYVLYREFGGSTTTGFISWLLWLTAPMLLLNVWWIYRSRDPVLQFVAISSAMALALMQFQFRFSVFAAVPMLLTPILAVRLLGESRPELRRMALAACCALFVVAFYPTVATWQSRYTLGGNAAYANLRSIFPVLKESCARHPGIVLGDLDTGHWVRYHSQCSVIADVFLLTPQHAAKAVESGRLLAQSPAELLTAKPEVRYVFAHHSATVTRDKSGVETPNLDEVRLRMQRVERDLLGPETNIPPQFKRLWEVRTPAGHVYARLYEIERNVMSDPTSGSAR
jgi:hypothetical protein